MPQRTPSSPTRPFVALVAVLVTLAVAAGQAIAHAVVYPPEAPIGAYQKYVLRVPNERGFPTSEVTITFPEGVRVISFDEVPGWTLETTSDDGGASFATATWTGTLPVGRFVEFGFIGVNPAEPIVLKWDVIQTYADGTAVPWTGPSDSSTPASTTSVVAQPTAPDAPASGLGTVLGGVALVVALVGLGLALRPTHAS